MKKKSNISDTLFDLLLTACAELGRMTLYWEVRIADKDLCVLFLPFYSVQYAVFLVQCMLCSDRIFFLQCSNIKKKIATFDTWHMTHATWNSACDMWHMLKKEKLWSKFQHLVGQIGHWEVKWFFRQFHKEALTQWMNQWTTRLFVGQPGYTGVSNMHTGDTKSLGVCG